MSTTILVTREQEAPEIGCAIQPQQTETIAPALLEYATFCSRVQSLLSLDVHSPSPAEFRGLLGHTRVDDSHVMHVRAGAHSVHRTSRHISHSAETHVKLTFVESGSLRILQDGKETTLAAGDLAIYQTGRPYTLVVEDRVSMSVLMVPVSRFTAVLSVIDQIVAEPIRERSGISQMMQPILARLSEAPGEFDELNLRVLVQALTDMVVALLLQQYRALANESDRSQRFTLAREYIERNLTDPELCPTEIASSLFISPRTLHAVFRERGTTVNSCIRERRLERAYQELVAPGAVSTVASIALRNGFVGVPHFTRVFRQYYGVTPGQARGRTAPPAGPAPAHPHITDS